MRNIDGALQAQTENAGNEYQKQLYEIMKATDDMFADYEESWWSRINGILLLLRLVRYCSFSAS